jgi:hypothetical protein
MIKKIWHSFLIFLLATALSFFLFFLLLHPFNLVYFTSQKLMAATGVGDSATVSENPVNQLAAALDEKEKQLDQKEQNLDDREEQLNKKNSFWDNGLLWAVFISLGVLGVLVVINFYFDRRREKELEILAERQTREELLEEEKP